MLFRSPDFYGALPYWCNTRWIGPARGYIDPTKEIAANIAAIEAGLMSRSEAIAERGGDKRMGTLTCGRWVAPMPSA